MKKVAKFFFSGLLIFVPVVGSIWLVFWAIAQLDGVYEGAFRLAGWEKQPIPGLGLVLTLVGITLLGALTSNVVGRKLVEGLEAGMKRLPVVNLIYSSLKDLLGAFVGDKRSFDKPVMVNVSPEHGIRVFGFVTCDRFDDVRLSGHVAVYLPQSYNFAGNMLIVKKELVEPVDAESAQFMAFIVSGGVAEMRGARTVFDSEHPLVVKKKR